jgi:hypothetical protein
MLLETSTVENNSSLERSFLAAFHSASLNIQQVLGKRYAGEWGMQQCYLSCLVFVYVCVIELPFWPI